MVETIRGYHLKDRKGLNHWDALLEEWLLAHERFCRIMKGCDDPAAYWYTEIPNVSILGAAAWRCGRIALQEFSTKKKVRGEEPWAGRGDLWICTDTNWKEELIEAKHKFVSLSGAKDKDGLPTTIKNSMEEATLAAKEARGGQRDVTALAVVFASLKAPKSANDKIDQLIKDFCETIKSSADYHASAWCFPKETRELQHPETGKYFPGIAMLIKNISTKRT
ncbi:MAG: hypothetical protein OXE42_01435 [Gammaproteobacteria bacterium]|nr:hypothetical protein [Gammaproteobacteria bacterium]